MKTITVGDETWQRLTILKAELMAKDLDEIIVKLLDKKMGWKNDNVDRT